MGDDGVEVGIANVHTRRASVMSQPSCTGDEGLDDGLTVDREILGFLAMWIPQSVLLTFRVGVNVARS